MNTLVRYLDLITKMHIILIKSVENGRRDQ